jgi:hypothetical protein
MSETSIEPRTGVLARFDAAIDDVLDLSLSALDGEAVLGLLVDLERLTRRLSAVDNALISEVAHRGLARDHGCASTAVLLTKVLRVGAGEARARVAAAEQLGPRHPFAGAPAPPEFARTAAAQVAGAISAAHARQITKAITDLPSPVRDEKFDDLEEFLVDQSRQFSPDELAKITRHLTDVLDPDGTLRDSAYRHRQRDLTIRRRPDGSAHGTFELTAQAAEALLSILDATAAPRPSADGLKDERSPGQRRHDGLQQAMLLALRSTDSSCNGVSTTIVITATAQQWAERRGLARTGHGSSLPMCDVADLAGDARLFPVVLGGPERDVGDDRTTAAPLTAELSRLFDTAKPVIAYGTNHRLFTEGERIAMIARDRGCSFPGCTVGPMWCEAHHIVDWEITRRTSVDDGTLLCGFHHREFERLGWSCKQIDGIPHWSAPRWIDPERTPRRNRAHDPLLVG